MSRHAPPDPVPSTSSGAASTNRGLIRRAADQSRSGSSALATTGSANNALVVRSNQGGYPAASSASPEPIDPLTAQKKLDSLMNELQELIRSDEVPDFNLPSFEEGERMCEKLIHSLDLVTGRNCYSKPNRIFQRRGAYNLWKPYNDLIKSKTEFVEEVKTICEKEIKKDDAARMSLQVYRNLIGICNSVLSVGMRSEEIYNTMREAAKSELQEKKKRQELRTAQVENVATILNAVASFVPDLHAL